MDTCQLPNILFLSAYDILSIDKSLAPVTLVLAEDGTIVDDDDYFLCLPSNTKFVALAGNEKWAYSNSGKEGGRVQSGLCHPTAITSHSTAQACGYCLSGWLSTYPTQVYRAPSICQVCAESWGEDEGDAGPVLK